MHDDGDPQRRDLKHDASDGDPQQHPGVLTRYSQQPAAAARRGLGTTAAPSRSRNAARICGASCRRRLHQQAAQPRKSTVGRDGGGPARARARILLSGPVHARSSWAVPAGLRSHRPGFGGRMIRGPGLRDRATRREDLDRAEANRGKADRGRFGRRRDAGGGPVAELRCRIRITAGAPRLWWGRGAKRAPTPGASGVRTAAPSVSGPPFARAPCPGVPCPGVPEGAAAAADIGRSSPAAFDAAARRPPCGPRGCGAPCGPCAGPTVAYR